MNRLTNGFEELNALIDLLRRSGGLDIYAYISPGQIADAPDLVVELTGSDIPLLTDGDGELLDAIEHIAANLIRLDTEDRRRLSFDAAGFKANRERALRQLANDAVVKVRTTCSAYTFPPMMSRERRLFHLALASSGLKSASTGDRFHRSVVLYPEGVHSPPE